MKGTLRFIGTGNYRVRTCLVDLGQLRAAVSLGRKESTFLAVRILVVARHQLYRVTPELLPRSFLVHRVGGREGRQKKNLALVHIIRVARFPDDIRSRDAVAVVGRISVPASLRQRDCFPLLGDGIPQRERTSVVEASEGISGREVSAAPMARPTRIVIGDYSAMGKEASRDGFVASDDARLPRRG